jgi:hemerythrin superfamily protein
VGAAQRFLFGAYGVFTRYREVLTVSNNDSGLLRRNMQSQTLQQLSDDHHAVGEVLKQLLTALDNKDVQTSYSKLDLLWARLAVHIRAEHLHLFPAVTSQLTNEAEAIVESLRADHNFFMHELARAIGILHELRRQQIVTTSDATKFAVVGEIVRQIEKRLATHNEIEEIQIYRWSSIMLSEQEQSDLLARISAELENRPPRFSAEAWANYV